MVQFKSRKKKLNTKSSTKAEVVGVSDYLPYIIWIFLFMREQRYDIKQNILFQDNQSAINMGKYGNKSCTGKSRHIDIRYFFAQYNIENQKIQLHTLVHNKCLQIFLLNTYKEPCSQNSITW